jgi:hypothetical protein
MTERLDRIESLLLGLTERQVTFQQQIEQSHQEVRANIVDVVGMVGILSSDIDALSSNVNAYIAQSTAFLAAEQRDRSEFRQQMIGLQTETRNILRELANLRWQSGNGNQE